MSNETIKLMIYTCQIDYKTGNYLCALIEYKIGVCCPLNRR